MVETARNDVIRQAMALFWRRGAEAASYNDIVEATGLSRKALYATWPDKDALIHETMTLYRLEVLGPLVATLRMGARAGLEAFWDALDTGVKVPGWSGCFLFRSASGPLREDTVIASHLEEHMGMLRREIEQALRDAAKNGEIINTAEVESVAWQCVAIAALISTYGAIAGYGKPVARLIEAGRVACGLA